MIARFFRWLLNIAAVENDEQAAAVARQRHVRDMAETIKHLADERLQAVLDRNEFCQERDDLRQERAELMLKNSAALVRIKELEFELESEVDSLKEAWTARGQTIKELTDTVEARNAEIKHVREQHAKVVAFKDAKIEAQQAEISLPRAEYNQLAIKDTKIFELQAWTKSLEDQVASLQAKIESLGAPAKPVKQEVGQSGDGPFKRHRLMGYECHAVGVALGISKGWRKLVLEFEVDKPAVAYVQHYIDNVDMDRLTGKLKGIVDGAESPSDPGGHEWVKPAPRETTVTEVKSVEVNKDGEVAFSKADLLAYFGPFEEKRS